jgi:5'-3' exoribonuclease 2
MGVPGLFGWFSSKCTREKLSHKCREKFNPDFDNVYIDMNGIIHPCTHPEHIHINDEKKMFFRICQYLDIMLARLKPQKLFYIAIDGVAPRAKVNQQRTRRFCSASQSAIADSLCDEMNENLKEKMIDEDGNEDIDKDLLLEYQKIWDSNVITPGTPFMEKVSILLHSYAMYKLNTDSSLKNLKIVIDDSSVPGEGEHKIISYIRKLRQDNNYDTSTTHVIHGLDGDLLLALALHEPNIYIVRDSSKTALPPLLDLVHVNVLRKRLINEFSTDVLLSLDAERMLDDFIFICTFCGNDFVPHLPGLAVHVEKKNGGGLNFLLESYKNYMIRNSKVKDRDFYLTNGASMNVESVLSFLRSIAGKCNEIVNNSVARGSRSHNLKQFYTKQIVEKPRWKPPKFFVKEIEYHRQKRSGDKKNVRMAWERIVQKAAIRISDTSISKVCLHPQVHVATEAGMTRYYMVKHDVPKEQVNELRQSLVTHYLQALDWVWSYYKTGLKSWTWFYPHHFAPLVSDFCDTSLDLTLHKYSLGAPLKPFTQLLCVLPQRSLHAVPEVVRNISLEMPEMYPDIFLRDSDYTDKAFKAVAILPFIDANKMKAAVAAVSDQLTPEEESRNSYGHAIVYFHADDLKLTIHHNQLKSDPIHTHSFKVVLKGSNFYRDDDRAASFAGYIFPVCHKEHMIGRLLPQLNEPINFKKRCPYFQTKLESNAVIPAILYPPAFEMKYWYSIPKQRADMDIDDIEVKYSPPIEAEDEDTIVVNRKRKISSLDQPASEPEAKRSRKKRRWYRSKAQKK